MKLTTYIIYHYCPALLNPSKDLADRVATFEVSARKAVRLITGDEMFERLDDVDFDPKVLNPELSAADAMMRMICLASICSALPTLDLVYTPNGFGVVSNQNLAPASADRVKRLLESLRNQMWDAYDVLLDELRHIAEWRTTAQAKIHFGSLFWRGSQMAMFDLSIPHRSDLIEYSSRIHSAELFLMAVISRAQFEKLCKAILDCDINDVYQRLISLCRSFVVRVVRNEPFDRDKREVLRFMETNRDDFPEYMNSREYEANHYKGYENRRRDSSFFFS